MSTATWTDVAGTEHAWTDVDRRDALALFVATFAGRTDAYSVWGGSHWVTACQAGCARCSWMGAHRGDDVPEQVPAHVRAPLTPDVVAHAFETRRPVSGYLLAPDSRTHLAALDVDRADGLLICDRVARAMRKAGIPAFVEPSRRGAHLWVVLDAPLPAIVVRRALRAFLAAAEVPDDPKVELRPGQDRLSGPDGLGHALRMPLMPHQATGVRGELLAPGGRIAAATIVDAIRLPWAHAPAFAEWAERWAPPVMDRSPRAPEQRPRSIERFNDQVGVCEILLADWGVPHATPGRAINCPAHDDRNPSLSILRDDRRVFCHSPGCLFNNDGRGRDAYDLAHLAGTTRKGAA